MLKFITPDKIIDHYSDFNPDEFKDKYDTVLFDLDNTLAPYYEKHIDDKARDFIYMLMEKGFKVYVVSNNKEERVKGFLEGTDIRYTYYSLKPLKTGYKRIIKREKLDPHKIITIGDQLLTDVIGSKRMGFYAIYVKPIIDKDSITTVINRKIEKFLFRYVVKKR